jgi:hypothetical protein
MPHAKDGTAEKAMITEVQNSTVEYECTCKECGGRFVVVRQRLANGRVVGGDGYNLPTRCTQCRNQWQRKHRNIYQCAYCGKEFTGRKRLYCSRDCCKHAQDVVAAARRLSLKKTWTCVTCGATVEGRKEKTCEKCRDENGRPVYRVQCCVCGKETLSARQSLRVCSEECRKDRYRQLEAARTKRRKAERDEAKSKWMSRKGSTIGSVVHVVGDAAEAMFDLLASLRGWMVAVPKSACASAGFDRIIDRGNGLERVQIKALLKGEKSGRCRLKASNGRSYARDAFELLAVMDVDTGDAWIMPWAEHCGETDWYVARHEDCKTHVFE